jgi:chemotaxis signal transduction protein
MSSNTISRVSNMTKSHMNNVMQIMLFQLNDKEYYGINVSKIKSIEDFKRYKVSKNEIKNGETSSILEGYINYHKQIIPFLNIEKWLGMYKEENSYMETVVCEYNRKIIAFPIFDI